MFKNPFSRFFYSGIIFLIPVFISSCGNQWPQFRGPDANMVAGARTLPEEWGEDLNVRWTNELTGQSWSSPVVWGNRVFVTSAVQVKQDTSYQGEVYRWEVGCIDLRSGEWLWNQVAREGNPRIRKNPATNYASETPVTDGKRLYAYFGMTGVFCYSPEGELLWEKDLGAFETQNGWGTGSSPVLYNDLLYIQVDNEVQSFLVALQKESGDEVWRADRDEKTNYSTPFIWKNRHRTELVTCGEKARAYDPLTGELLWELEIKGGYRIPSPVADEEYLYLVTTSNREIPSTLFCVNAGGEEEPTGTGGEIPSPSVAWSLSDLPTGNPSPLLHEGLLYLVSSRGGEVTCLDAGTGEEVYREKLEGVAACWASPWIHGEQIYFTDEKGSTRIFRAGRNFELTGQNDLKDKFWASMAVAGDAYLLKGVERLYCIGK